MRVLPASFCSSLMGIMIPDAQPLKILIITHKKSSSLDAYLSGDSLSGKGIQYSSLLLGL